MSWESIGESDLNLQFLISAVLTIWKIRFSYAGNLKQLQRTQDFPERFVFHSLLGFWWLWIENIWSVMNGLALLSEGK